MKQKGNAHSAQFGTLVTALKAASNAFYPISSAVFQLYGVGLAMNTEVRLFIFCYSHC
jgi:hypothetical protein